MTFLRRFTRLRHWLRGSIPMPELYICTSCWAATRGPCQTHHGLPLLSILAGYDERLAIAQRAAEKLRLRKLAVVSKKGSAANAAPKVVRLAARQPTVMHVE